MREARLAMRMMAHAHEGKALVHLMSSRSMTFSISTTEIRPTRSSARHCNLRPLRCRRVTSQTVSGDGGRRESCGVACGSDYGRVARPSCDLGVRKLGKGSYEFEGGGRTACSCSSRTTIGHTEARGGATGNEGEGLRWLPKEEVPETRLPRWYTFGFRMRWPGGAAPRRSPRVSARQTPRVPAFLTFTQPVPPLHPVSP